MREKASFAAVGVICAAFAFCPAALAANDEDEINADSASSEGGAPKATAGQVYEEPQMRDPFLPINYDPNAKPVTADVAPVVVDAAGESDRKKSVLIIEYLDDVPESAWAMAEKGVGMNPKRYSVTRRADGKAFVFIANKVRRVDDVFTYTIDNYDFSWKVVSIESANVVFERMSVTPHVPKR